MITNLDEHFILATIEGQTRAMNRYDESDVRLDYRRTMTIFRDAAEQYAWGWEMHRALEFALDVNEPFADDAERHGYKVALGIEFNRRKQKGLAVIEELERTRPFAPR